jgi:hypothetical protein
MAGRKEEDCAGSAGRGWTGRANLGWREREEEIRLERRRYSVESRCDVKAVGRSRRTKHERNGHGKSIGLVR